MLAEVAAECGTEDPVLVVPWEGFVDLRVDIDALDSISEADAQPPLLEALRSLNSPRSLLFTAKCDAWEFDDEERELLRAHLEAESMEMIVAEEAAAGFACYIDVLWRDRSIFASQHRQQQLLHRIARYAAVLQHPRSMLELVLRPAMVDLSQTQEGFSTTLYIKALGGDSHEAWERWADALRSVTALMRSTDLSA